MFIDINKNNGRPYIRVCKSQRMPNANGVVIAKKIVVANIGPVSRFDDGQPDYVLRLRDSFAAGDPLIPELKQYCSEEKKATEYTFKIVAGSAACKGHSKLFSNILLEKVLEELGMEKLFAEIKFASKIKFDLYGFFKLLIMGRVLNPASKISTVSQNDKYYQPIIKKPKSGNEEINPDNVYDTLDVVYKNRAKIMNKVNSELRGKRNRSPEIIFYDVTNFYFETDEPDPDILDENGETVEKGFRKMGVSKEERKLPLVQMGLFMDDEGFPITIESFPGNTLDHLTLRTALKNRVDNMDFKRFILIADRGIFNYPNALHVLDNGNGYIISKSILKCPYTEQKWIYDDADYIQLNDSFKYKSRIMERTVTDENGNKRSIKEKVVVYWSEKFQKRGEYENARFLEFLTRLEKAPENFRITAIEMKKIHRFMSKEYVNTKTGEVMNSKDIRGFIDFKKVEEYRHSLGFYQIVTSELDMDPLEVIEKYHGLTQIEDQFRTMKGTLEGRPCFVRTKEHIDAHLLICMLALITIRIIQKRILDSGITEINKELYWNTGLSSARIQNALNCWKIELFAEGLYRFMDVDDPDLQLILKAFDIVLEDDLYLPAKLKKIKTSINVLN